MRSDNQENKNAALNTLYICLDTALKLLHPTMPYLTEELYQRLPHSEALRSESICISAFPQKQILPFETTNIEENMNKLTNTVKSVRSQLAALNVASNAKPTIIVQTSSQALLQVFKSETPVLTSLMKSGETIILSAEEKIPDGCVKGFVSDEISTFVKVIGLIDLNLEINRINKRIK